MERKGLNTVEVLNVTKSFGAIKAVDEVSFSVGKGEIFGLLGPNGAGKTTTIRLILDIFKPESGEVEVLGGPMNEATKNRIGYMPEERGLYQDIPLERCLVYLGSLKGLSPSVVKQRAGEYLERFDLTAHKSHKIKELSKGMQQKAQIIVTLLHQPELVIIDEPFTSLDPVNTQLVKELLRELRTRGVTLIMSTHQMHQVEELCDRILLINHGKAVLYGGLDNIRQQYASHAVLVKSKVDLPALPGVEKMEEHNSSVKMTLASGTTPQGVLEELVKRNVPLEQFEIATPTLDEIFIRVVQGEVGPGE